MIRMYCDERDDTHELRMMRDHTYVRDDCVARGVDINLTSRYF